MASAVPTAADVDAYRSQADRFIAELDEEYYLHFAGHKERLELEPIYERHAELTTLEKARALEHAATDARSRELWRFACEGYLGALSRAQAERVAELEAQLEADIDGEKIGFRMLRPSIANEPDRARRERIDRARVELNEQLVPVYEEGARIEKAAVRELGVDNYVDLYRRFGFQLDELADDCRALLDSTEQLYDTAVDRLFKSRIGIGLGDVRRWDTLRAFRAPDWDPHFPADRMLPALEATLADLGVDLHGQQNVHLDLEKRPLKTPRAFCAPIEIPDRVMLVIQPIGGSDDWAALFHEAGHTEHYAHTDASLSMEEKRLGDLAVTEGWAALMEHLTDDPAWLNRRLDFPRAREYAAEGMAALLYIVRRYCAKLLYELEFHATDDLAAMKKRYVEILSDALKVEPSDTDFLADIDNGFYVTSYIRSWAFEAQMRTYLREQFGNEWFTRREAGSLLRELWSEGQARRADDLLADVTGSALELEAIAERIHEHVH